MIKYIYIVCDAKGKILSVFSGWHWVKRRYGENINIIWSTSPEFKTWEEKNRIDAYDYDKSACGYDRTSAELQYTVDMKVLNEKL